MGEKGIIRKCSVSTLDPREREREGEIKSVVHQQSTDKTNSITTDNSSTKNHLKPLGIYTNQKSGGHPGPDFLVMALGASLTSSFAL